MHALKGPRVGLGAWHEGGHFLQPGLTSGIAVSHELKPRHLAASHVWAPILAPSRIDALDRAQLTAHGVAARLVAHGAGLAHANGARLAVLFMRRRRGRRGALV